MEDMYECMIDRYHRYVSRNIYVLMRLYCHDLSGMDLFLKGLKPSLDSVRLNKCTYEKSCIGRKVILLVNDDTISLGNKEDYDRYKSGRDRLLTEYLGSDWKETEKKGQEKGNMGASLSLHLLRKLFIDMAADRDIAVILDQDDLLADMALINIAKEMKPRGVVISPYSVDRQLDFTDDGGRIHNEAVSKLSSGCVYNITSILQDFSSICWTKAYSRFALKRYHEDIEGFFLTRKGAEAFFREHHAYEDFMDFYVLLLRGIRISGNNCCTHIYLRNERSITSNPSVDDFKFHRTACLKALIDMCYAKKDVLRRDFKTALFRYTASKVYQIEAILRRYNSDYFKGDASKIDFAKFRQETPDFFINRFVESWQSGDHNFEDLFSVDNFNKIQEYNVFNDEKIAGKEVLKKAMEEEGVMRKSKKHRDKDITCGFISRGDTPHRKQYKSIANIISLGGGIVCVLIFAMMVFNHKGEEIIAQIISLSLSCAVAIFGILFTYRSNLEVKAEEEESNKTLFFSEFLDLIRHLRANLKIMIEIRKRIFWEDYSGSTFRGGNAPRPFKVSKIHFDNLEWPESSLLFSNAMAKVINRNRVDDFSRLKVNLRNINNSAKWLSEAVGEGKDISSLLEWEISRNIGYLINFEYMKEHDFQFPNSEQMDRYVKESDILASLGDLFLGYDVASRKNAVNYFISKYYADRRNHREVLMVPLE